MSTPPTASGITRYLKSYVTTFTVNGRLHTSERPHTTREHLLTRTGFDPQVFDLFETIYLEPRRVSIEGRVIEWNKTLRLVGSGEIVVLVEGHEFVARVRT